MAAVTAPQAALPPPPPEKDPSTPPARAAFALSSNNPTSQSGPAAAASAVAELTSTAASPIAGPPRTKRLSLTFWRPAPKDVAPLNNASSSPTSTPVGHQARVLFALLSGQTPPSRSDRLVRPSHAVLSAPTLSEAAVSCDGAKPAAPHVHVAKIKGKKAAQHQQKAMKKLKHQLQKPSEARKIVCDLKRMAAPDPTDSDETTSAFDSAGLPHPKTRGYALPPLEDPSVDTPSSSPNPELPNTYPSSPEAKKLEAYIILPSPSLPPSTPGGLGAIAGAKSGAFDLLADASGALVRKSRSQEGFVAPFDAIGVFIYWWGFELTLPPPTLRTLAAIDNVQSTLFPFLQAVVIGGGVPELAPLIRYISSWVQMELGAIKQQNRGHGGVLAATWLLPVALVPRPWDFPLPIRLPA